MRILLSQALALCLAGPAIAGTYILPDGRSIDPLETFRECDVCPEMIVLPLGSFTMGAPLAESAPIDFETPQGVQPRGNWTEGPMHRVEIDLPIAMGRNEITHDEWMMCVAEGGCTHQPPTTIRTYDGEADVTGNDPVLNVSYQDMQTYLAWLNARVGEPAYRLPTEAEWEYAARAGTSTPFAQGDRLTADQANFSVRATASTDGTPIPTDRRPIEPVPVNTLDAANAWGLRHMAGNATERTMSCWSNRHHEWNTSSEHLRRFAAVQTCARVSKGGGYAGHMLYSRPAHRGRAPDTFRSDVTGFRVVRDLYWTAEN